MKRARQVGIVCSVLLMIQSGVMGILLLWFNRFATTIFFPISNLPFRLLALYWGFLLGLVCFYTAYRYKKPGFIASTFFIGVGLLGLVNAIKIPNIYFLIYTIVLAFGFLYTGVIGHYYRQLNANLYEGKKHAKPKHKTISTKK